MNAPIVTLTTDWGTRDFFVALVKGRLCSLIPDVKIIDISHSQIWKDSAATIGIIRNGLTSFPDGSVHIVDVGCECKQADGKPLLKITTPLAVHWRGQYIICSERRLLEQSLDGDCDEVVELPLSRTAESYSFLANDMYCGVAQKIIAGTPLQQIGEACEPLRCRLQPPAQTDGDRLVAMVTSIDSYGNANLNITYREFESFRADRHFRVKIEWRVGSSDRFDDITGISKHYNDVRMGNVLLTVSSTGQLQIAINKGSAAQLIGLGFASKCHFIFES